MRILMVGLAALWVAGCVSADVRGTGAGTFELSSSYDWTAPRYGIADYLAKRSSEACPRGFEKLSERDTPNGSTTTLTWQIRCL